jgi:signal transduction histidine kinase/CheY-like chemotaxis protein
VSRSRLETPGAIESLGDGAEAAPLRELALHRWIDRILRNHSADRVLDRLLDAVLDGLSIHFGLVGHIDQAGDLRVMTLRLPGAMTSGAPGAEIRVAAEDWDEHPFALARQGHCVKLEGPLPLPGGFDAEGSFAAAPLVHQGEAMGLLVVGPRSRGREHDLDLLEAAAGRATPVLDATIHREAHSRTVSSMQTQLLQSQRMEAIGQLAGGIAHDFNNLLTAILGYCNLMAYELEEGSDLHADLLEIRRAADRAASLTKQLLTFSRSQPRQPRQVDVNEVIEGLDPMLRRLLVETIELTTDLAPTLGFTHADPTQLERVLMNLVVNARDAMPDGGRLCICTRNLDLARADDDRFLGLEPGSYIQLEVSDTGEGMDAETQLRVFEPFFTTKPEGKGTGLGLATVYGIVKQAEGSIWIDSARGVGSCFRICLPRHFGAAGARRDPKSGQLISPYRGTETVLLVEDDDPVMILTRRILERFGYEVLTAVDSVSALRLATTHDGPIHVLLTDVVLPGASGPKLAASLADLRPHTKVMYMSGHIDEELVQHVNPSDRAPLLAKPFRPLDLARALRKLLDPRE